VNRKYVSDEMTLSWHPYHTRLNFEFVIDGVEMVEYMVQLEYNEGTLSRPNWRQVARSDTDHDFFHIDLHYAEGRKEKYIQQLPQTLSTGAE